MNEENYSFLYEMMLERMTRIYAADRNKRSREIQEYNALEDRLNHALALLPAEQVKCVRQYIDYLFQQDADKEVFFYRNGLVDGYRLCRTIQRMVDSA